MDESSFVISSYTVDDALNDGVLLSMTEMLDGMNEKPFTIEAFMTPRFYEDLINAEHCNPEAMQDQKGRLWDIVSVSAARLREATETERAQGAMLVKVLRVPADGISRKPRMTDFKITIGARNEDGTPALFFMLPEED